MENTPSYAWGSIMIAAFGMAATVMAPESRDVLGWVLVAFGCLAGLIGVFQWHAENRHRHLRDLRDVAGPFWGRMSELLREEREDADRATLRALTLSASWEYEQREPRAAALIERAAEKAYPRQGHPDATVEDARRKIARVVEAWGSGTPTLFLPGFIRKEVWPGHETTLILYSYVSQANIKHTGDSAGSDHHLCKVMERAGA